jgi:hypothetical protein
MDICGTFGTREITQWSERPLKGSEVFGADVVPGVVPTIFEFHTTKRKPLKGLVGAPGLEPGTR